MSIFKISSSIPSLFLLTSVISYNSAHRNGSFFVDHCNFPYVRFVLEREVMVSEMNNC
jgi:hypothetical protein